MEFYHQKDTYYILINQVSKFNIGSTAKDYFYLSEHIIIDTDRYGFDVYIHILYQCDMFYTENLILLNFVIISVLNFLYVNISKPSLVYIKHCIM